MKKAFIFDIDGVLVNSVQIWVGQENGFLKDLLGDEIHRKIGDLIGVSVSSTYERARELGLLISRDEFQRRYDAVAFSVYDRATITAGTEELARFLLTNDFKLGIVSSSPAIWIDRVLDRLTFRDQIEVIVSLNERTDLEPKPYPAGYIEAMRLLGCSVRETIMLEDSTPGILAAKASGAHTIAFTQHLVDGYRQIEADAKADTMEDVITLVKKSPFSHRPRTFTDSLRE